MQWNAEGDEILLILVLSNGGYKCLFCIISLSLTLQYLAATGNYLKLSYSYFETMFQIIRSCALNLFWINLR